MTWLLWTVHILALVVFAALAVGLFSRTAAILAFPLAVSYVHRVTPGAYFGLDKVNCMLAMYLLLGRAGRATRSTGSASFATATATTRPIARRPTWPSG